MSRHVVIVGGGVIGLCTAWFLAARGHRVTVLERSPQGHEGCSFGNAGLLSPSHFVPLAAPGTIRLALRWMLSPESPFWVRPRLNWDLLTWGWKFYRASTAAHVERSAPLLRDLNLASLHAYEELAAGSENDFGLVERGVLMLCATEHGLEEEARTAEMAHRLGMQAEVFDAKGAAALEPGLRLSVAGGVLYPQDAHLSPMRLMASLTQRLAGAGVDVRRECEALGWHVHGARIEAVRTREGEVAGDEFVVCGGSWTPGLVRELGLRLPLQAGKGYSLTLPRPRQKPTRGMILIEGRVAVTPMGEALRFGGTMEIAGMSQDVRPGRVRGLVKSVVRYLPEFTPEDFREIQPWCGLRPCSPDGLPYIGRFARTVNLSVATGHAMLGVSLAPITGRLIAELLSGEAPSIPLEALSPDRYSRTR
jgi:D-amino-acid dehydrogenase